MKVAVTADIHLKTQAETPERFNALENIFQQTKQRGISNLFIAGDLFDKDFFNYNDFESLCKKYPDIYVTIIPGNHDHQIEKKFFRETNNIEIVREPFIKKIEGLSFLFIPYDSEKTIDEILTELNHDKKLPKKWVLISHGDYITTNKEVNLYEPGVYMPISSKTINKYNPLKVILGHIHKPSEFGKVIYPGSPCGLDITETGKRSFIIYDTKTNEIERPFVETGKIYFIESILIYPVEDEKELLRKKIDQLIKNWELSNEELQKVKLRLIIKGWTKDKNRLNNLIVDLLKEKNISLYDPDGPDFSEVKVVKDIEEERIFIFEKVKQKIENLQSQNFRTSKDKILEEALELILKE